MCVLAAVVCAGAADGGERERGIVHAEVDRLNCMRDVGLFAVLENLEDPGCGRREKMYIVYSSREGKTKVGRQ